MPLQTIERHDPENEGAPGLVDLIVTLTDEEAALLGGDEMAAGEPAHLTAWALILLRTLERDGTYTSRYRDKGDPDDDLASLRGLIVALDKTVLPRLHGIRDAAIRAHQDRGGSYGKLAAAMNVPRSTAQTRADALTAQDPSPYERWARGLGPRPSSPAPVDISEPREIFIDPATIVRLDGREEFDPSTGRVRQRWTVGTAPDGTPVLLTEAPAPGYPTGEGWPKLAERPLYRVWAYGSIAAARQDRDEQMTRGYRTDAEIAEHIRDV